MTRLNYNLDDAFWRTLLSPFEGTIWAKDFRLENFEKVFMGMSSQEVYKLLGTPLRSHCTPEGCLLIYSWQDTGTADFDQRWVGINSIGQVNEIRKSFFID